MFTWICPQCGQEVPPSSPECPECARRARESASGAVLTAPASTVSQTAAPSRRAPAPSRSASPPAWLLALVFAGVFISMGTLGYVAFRYFSHRSEPLQAPEAQPVRTPRTAPAESATPTANILNKYIEVTGLRLLEENPKQLQVQFLVVNHSLAPLTDLSGTVAIRPTTAGPDGETIGAFSFHIPELRPLESKELKAPLQSKLRVYELPDWQFIRADVTITSPQPTP
mgnify:CR=1 FL=1